MQSLPPLLSLQGSLAPGEEQVLTVYYLPGKIGVFCTTVRVQVLYLDPAEIFLKGEGILCTRTKKQHGKLKSEHSLSSSRKISWFFPLP